MEGVEWISDEAAFAALGEEWDRLLPADPTPFDLHCWYESWWAAFRGDEELATCVLRRDGALAGVFPLRRSAAGLLPLANEHSSRFRPLGVDGGALEAIWAAAIAKSGGELTIQSLPAGDPCVAAFASAAHAARRPSHFEPLYASPYVETDGDFEEWRAQSKKRWGAPLERFRRKMGRDHEALFRIVEPPEDLEAELEAGFLVEAGGWKGEQGTAILSQPETAAFYREIGRRFDDRGELRLSRIDLDGETAAFDFCLLHDNRLHLLKTGFDERHRRLAPGLVMRLSIVERCFELGLASHELLGTVSEWKMKFATGTRGFGSGTVYSRSPAGRARRAYRAALRPRLKRAYRRVRRSG
jgi:CelD/BcsL family acetyltransferase involved in cellulose biosynthesis